jgi:ABC-2 type transport system permease protein
LKGITEAKKFYADGTGSETEAHLADSIEIGLFKARPGIGTFSADDVIAIARMPVRSGSQSIVVRSRIKPSFAGLDPYNFYIDRNGDDNVSEVLE